MPAYDHPIRRNGHDGLFIRPGTVRGAGSCLQIFFGQAEPLSEDRAKLGKRVVAAIG
jgi:hypothetical protein